MQELDAQATVVDAGGISGGLTTTISRSDVQTALAESELPPLVLDIRRGDESNSVALTWKREDLERLLNEATGDQIQLTFDGQAIAQAFDDVEAHGIREKAAIVAVAVAGAAAFAGTAAGMPMGTEGGPAAAPVAMLSGPSGVHLGDTTAGIDPAIAAGMQSGPSGVHLGDTTAVNASTDDPAIATAMRDAQSPQAAAPVDDPVIAAAIANYAEAPAAAHIGDTTAGTQTGLNTETGPSGAHLGDVTAGAGPQVSYATDSGTSWSDVGSGVAAVGAGAAILIVGAAFAAGASRRRAPGAPA